MLMKMHDMIVPRKNAQQNTFLILNPPSTKFCLISIVFVLHNVEGTRAFVFCIAQVFYHVFNLCELSMFVVFTCGQVVQAFACCVNLWLKFFLGWGK
jgi:hypothetical protein